MCTSLLTIFLWAHLLSIETFAKWLLYAASKSSWKLTTLKLTALEIDGTGNWRHWHWKMTVLENGGTKVLPTKNWNNWTVYCVTITNFFAKLASSFNYSPYLQAQLSNHQPPNPKTPNLNPKLNYKAKMLNFYPETLNLSPKSFYNSPIMFPKLWACGPDPNVIPKAPDLTPNLKNPKINFFFHWQHFSTAIFQYRHFPVPSIFQSVNFHDPASNCNFRFQTKSNCKL